MHGQKKRRKRTAKGTFEIEGVALRWQLLSEPQWTTDGPKGLCFSVRREAERNRELILEYSFQQPGLTPQFPQRPAFTQMTIEADIRRAIAAGWNPISRGKAFVFQVPAIEQDK